MRRASRLIFFSGLLLLAVRSQSAAAAGTELPRRQIVPDDPLAGLPTGDEPANQPARGKPTGKGAHACQVNANAANNREIGDLRATLAFLQRGPRSWACPAEQGRGGEVRLRIAVDGTGRITEVQPAGGDGNVAAALAKKLVGQAIAPRPDGPTQGTVVLSFASGKK